MKIGTRLKKARERFHPEMTQEEVGRVFGITAKAVSSWERNETTPAPAKFPALRKKLKITFAYLLQGEGDPPAPDDPLVLLEDSVAARYEALGKNEPLPATPTKRRK